MTVLLIGLATLIGTGITTQVETCCDPECVNGWCFDGTCICDFPWEGVACEVEREPEPCDLPCENGSEPDFFCNRCLCVVGSNCGGTFCNICSPPPVCDPPCVNGSCRSGNVCSCQQGWTGSRCEVPITGCDPVCVHGFCRELFGGLRCTCEQGWTGTACDECAFGHEGPNCDPIPCDPECVNGTCIAGLCQCEDPGWVGDACDEPRCCDPDCVNGIFRGLDVCDCDGGWEGPLCDLQQHLLLDAMVEICGGGDEQDERRTRGNGGQLGSLLAQEVTPVGVAGVGVSSVWNAQRVQSSAAASARIQLESTGAGSSISDELIITPISDQDCRGSNSACRLKFDFAIVGGTSVSAPLWGDEIARAQTSFFIDFEQFKVSNAIRVRHDWVNCSKIEPCVPGTLCQTCEGGSVKLGEGTLTQFSFDARICRSEFEPPPLGLSGFAT